MHIVDSGLFAEAPKTDCITGYAHFFSWQSSFRMQRLQSYVMMDESEHVIDGVLIYRKEMDFCLQWGLMLPHYYSMSDTCASRRSRLFLAEQSYMGSF
jgi:hypothetical protein